MIIASYWILRLVVPAAVLAHRIRRTGGASV